MDSYMEEIGRAAGPLKDNLLAMLAQWEEKVPDPRKHLQNMDKVPDFRCNTKETDAMVLQRYFAEESTHTLMFMVSRTGYRLFEFHELFRSSIGMAEALAALDLREYAKQYLRQATLISDLRSMKCSAVPSGLFMIFYVVRSLGIQAENSTQRLLDDIRTDLSQVAFYLRLARYLLGLQGFYRETLIYTNSVAHQIFYQAVLESAAILRPDSNSLVHCAIAFATMFLSPCPSVLIYRGRERELQQFWSNAPRQIERYIVDAPTTPLPMCRLFRAKFVPRDPLPLAEARAAEQVESIYIAAYDMSLRSAWFYLEQNPSDLFVDLLRQA